MNYANIKYFDIANACFTGEIKNPPKFHGKIRFYLLYHDLPQIARLIYHLRGIRQPQPRRFSISSSCFIASS